MKIESVTVSRCYDIQAGGKFYRRWGPDAWEQQLGDSWEPLYFCEAIEAEFQKQFKI